MPVRGTSPAQIWLHCDPSDLSRLLPRVLDVMRICQRSPSAMAGTSSDSMAGLSAPDLTVQYTIAAQ